MASLLAANALENFEELGASDDAMLQQIFAPSAADKKMTAAYDHTNPNPAPAPNPSPPSPPRGRRPLGVCFCLIFLKFSCILTGNP